MAYVKRISMDGFKSFAKKTDILFDKGINVILGPNGSGKSNISDALCFVLGRLSVKSMRAAKSGNLIFMGSKTAKPMKEASVEIAFDNSDRHFGIDNDEITIQRVVRRNGQGIYKINGETKTRGEIIETLAHAGIDPHGFNIVLQGEIQAIVKMHPDERRKIVEEVAGISIYETRKEKSLKELEKTEERLKEISTILRERNAYLRNLESERVQAMRYKELESMIKRTKASIMNNKIEQKKKDIDKIVKEIDERIKNKDRMREEGDRIGSEIEKISEKINEINRYIQKASGVEQEKIHTQIGDLKAEIEGLKARKESYERRKEENERRISEIEKSIPSLEEEIKILREKSPLVAKKVQELKKRKEELNIIEEERKKIIGIKSEIISLKERIKEKEAQISKNSEESESVLKVIEEYSKDFDYKDEAECLKKISLIKEEFGKLYGEKENIGKNIIENEKRISVFESEIETQKKVIGDVQKIDTCPLCQSKMSEEHVSHVMKSSDGKIKENIMLIENIKREIGNISEEINKIVQKLSENEKRSERCNIELANHRALSEKKELLKRIVDNDNVIKKEIESLLERRKNLEGKSYDAEHIEERYQDKIHEIEEISSRTEEDVDNTILMKERELEKYQQILESSKNNIEDIGSEIEEISGTLEEKSSELEEREEKVKEMNDKFNKMFEERDSLQKQIQEKGIGLSESQRIVNGIVEQINDLKNAKARIDAEKEAVEMDMEDYKDAELVSGSVSVLEDKLIRYQEAFSKIGSVNMRALEIYDEIKKEYDIVQEKVNKIDSEKQGILSIIEEIDKKKKKEFMKAFRAINEKFSENFSKLYTKGTAYLELQNEEDIFAGGVDIVVRLGKGKYFDITSLSGGEKTLVALALLFAIQEYKPYHFYVFDEIDAALDKRNSERLTGLLNQYMKDGQYIVITHNDAVITNSNLLYGVSMHEGISKVLSLKLD